jgi:hypothetical protein
MLENFETIRQDVLRLIALDEQAIPHHATFSTAIEPPYSSTKG